MAKSGKVAIVTGSATGVGASCALDLAERGWNVVINYTKSKKEADETYEKVKAKGVEAILVQADMGLAALAPDGARRRLQLLHGAPGAQHRGAGSRQSHGHVAAQPARGAGQQHHAILHRKQIGHVPFALPVGPILAYEGRREISGEATWRNRARWRS